MALVTLKGRLICASAEQRRAVLRALPEHMRATLREPGCLYFDVTQSADPMIWEVCEGFASEAAFDAHQSRTRDSAWFAQTRDIARDYVKSSARAEITTEAEGDAKAIYLLHRDGFGREDEAKFVDDLRAAGDLVLSVVARLGRAYMGHVAFTPMIGAPKVWALAPVVVRDSCRNQGVGTALVEAALEIAREKGVDAILSPSEQPFFKRFGFTLEDAASYRSPSVKTRLIARNFRTTPLDGRDHSWHPAFERLA